MGQAKPNPVQDQELQQNVSFSARRHNGRSLDFAGNSKTRWI